MSSTTTIWVDVTAFNPDSKYLATAGGDEGIIQIWDTTNYQEVARISGPKSIFIRNLLFSPNGKHLLALFGSEVIKVYTIK